MKINEDLKEAEVEKKTIGKTKTATAVKTASVKTAKTGKTATTKKKKEACARKSAAKAGAAEKKIVAVKKTVTKRKKGDVKTALLKKAMGYDASEITEEYSVGENGEVSLSKRKVIKKNVPPDVAAIKYLLECEGGVEKPLNDMTDEELLAEKERLLRELANEG